MDAAPILVVEDDASIREMIALSLGLEDLPVAVASDGARAIEIADAQRPAAVVLDMGLPIIDGDGVASAIRARYGDTVPIVVVTANGHAEDSARRVGAVAFLPKPFEVDQLIDRVRSAVGRREDEEAVIPGDLVSALMPA